ncbi:MAG: sulfite exporter TauE/SafE family protein, partial [Clostridia bacterium]|nr:sulfite exporter TauE/SafE family protein [Clostridia bacterium]
MEYLFYIIAGLAGGVLIGMAGLTAAMVLTPILSGACGWNGYDATTMALIANVPSAIVSSCTYYKNGNVDMKRGGTISISAFAGAVAGSWLGYLFSQVSENGISYLVIIGNLFMAIKFFCPAKQKSETSALDSEHIVRERRKTLLALLLSFLIGAECGFMGSAGGMMMLMVLT